MLVSEPKRPSGLRAYVGFVLVMVFLISFFSLLIWRYVHGQYSYPDAPNGFGPEWQCEGNRPAREGICVKAPIRPAKERSLGNVTRP